MTDPILSVRDLSVAFHQGGNTSIAVDHISFEIKRGETVALVGESGSGKSVSANSILKLLPYPSASHPSGEIVFNGKDLLKAGDAELRNVRGNDITMIFQEPMTSLNPLHSIERQIGEILELHQGLEGAAARTRILELLNQVGIREPEKRLSAYPHELSGGQRQRVMIAMALANRPELLIADEPTTALDVTVQAEILQLIKSLQDEEKMAVLFITHDMGVVAEIADRTVVMFRSRALETGKTEQIFTRPSNVYTKALLSAVPRLGSMEGRAFPATLPLTDTDTGAVLPEREIEGTVENNKRPILEVRNLVTRFDIKSGLFGRVSSRVHAVENVSFDLHAGETLSLVGESGCGKSTTGRMIVGIERPSGGEILFKGRDLTSLTPKDWQRQRRDIQMIFQNPQSALDPRLSIGRQIREPLDLHEIGERSGRDAETLRLMQAVALAPEMADRFPHQISGGQAQRVVIARALAMKPSLIVCDEPVSALDVSVQATVTELLQELQERFDIAYLFISHDLRVVKKLSHRIAVMYLGQIVEEGPTDPVYRAPRHPYTMALLAAIPDLSTSRSTRPMRLAGDPPSPANPPAGCHFHTRCPYARPRCSAEMPVLRPLGEGRSVRCHFAGELGVAS